MISRRGLRLQHLQKRNVPPQWIERSRRKHETKAVPVYSDDNIHQVTIAKPLSDDVTNTDSNVTAEADNVTAVETKSEEPMAKNNLQEAIAASAVTAAPTTGKMQVTTTSTTEKPDLASMTTPDENDSETEADESPQESSTKSTRRKSIYDTPTEGEKGSEEDDASDTSKRSSSEEEKSMSVEDLETVRENDDIVIRIAARAVPKYIYRQPKIKVKHTKTAKFRHMYNRRPKGARVFFKPLDNSETKPPFIITAAIARCTSNPSS